MRAVKMLLVTCKTSGRVNIILYSAMGIFLYAKVVPSPLLECAALKNYFREPGNCRRPALGPC